MHIGLKYCGGCNSRYDRTQEVQKLMRALPQHTFTYSAAGDTCDILLLICGCMTACPTADGIAAKEVRLLRTPREFAAFSKELAAGYTVQEEVQRHLAIGDQAAMTKTFTAADIASFAAVSGDFGRLHTDASFAKRYGFGQPVVHGVLVGSLMSSVMGMQLPGGGTILMDEQLTFSVPVYVGDTITAMVTLQDIAEKKRWYVATLHGSCTNQDGITVVTGTYHQLLMKPLFTIDHIEK